jgi:hypothetical protein
LAWRGIDRCDNHPPHYFSDQVRLYTRYTHESFFYWGRLFILMLRINGIDIRRCPRCRKGQLVVICKIPKGSHIPDPLTPAIFAKTD